MVTGDGWRETGDGAGCRVPGDGRRATGAGCRVARDGWRETGGARWVPGAGVTGDGRRVPGAGVRRQVAAGENGSHPFTIPWNLLPLHSYGK